MDERFSVEHLSCSAVGVFDMFVLSLMVEDGLKLTGRGLGFCAVLVVVVVLSLSLRYVKLAEEAGADKSTSFALELLRPLGLFLFDLTVGNFAVFTPVAHRSAERLISSRDGGKCLGPSGETACGIAVCASLFAERNPSTINGLAS
jgi:hypothetical protein